MVNSRPIDHIHLFHHHLMSQVGGLLSDSWIMKRDVGEAISAAIETLQSPDLRFAKVALAIKDHDICAGVFVGIGQLILLNHGFFAQNRVNRGHFKKTRSFALIEPRSSLVY